jgi:integrase
MLRRMLDGMGDRLIDARDRALLSFGMASAMRRSELVALEVADLTETPDGLRVLIRRSKTDQEAQGAEIAIPRGAKLRPVEALQIWLARAEISTGPLFRHVKRGDRIGDPLLPEAVSRIVKKHAARLGLDPASFGGHSLRSGFVTSAVEAHAPLLKIAEQTRHRSLDMLRVYSRRVDLFRDHAGSSFL